VEAGGVHHICHLNLDTLKVIIARRLTVLSICIKVKLAAPDSNASLESVGLSLLHLRVKDRWLRLETLKMGLCEALLTKFDGEIILVRHFDIAEECASFVCKEELNCNDTLEEAQLGQLKSIIRVLK